MAEEYYIPERKEFFEGFQYEIFDTGLREYTSKIFQLSDAGCVNSYNKIRVKYLTPQDITDCGWGVPSEKDGVFYFKKDNKILRFDQSTMAVVIKPSVNNYEPLFVGRVKNVSRLIAIMEMVM